MVVARRNRLKGGGDSVVEDDIYDADETAALTSAGYDSASIAEAARHRDQTEGPAPTVSI